MRYVTVVLEKGTYHIYPDDVTKRTFKITNSMSESKCIEAGASYEKNLGIVVEGNIALGTKRVSWLQAKSCTQE